MFAGTVVISERGPKPIAPPTMPPSLRWWAATLNRPGLEPQQTEVARQFLAREPELTPAIRDEMAYRVAAEIVSRISPPPPPGTPPQLVLAAVLAERHRRALHRLGITRAGQRYPGIVPAGVRLRVRTVFPDNGFAPPQ